MSDEELTPHPALAGHPLPWGEGGDRGRRERIQPSPRGRGCPDWSGRVRGVRNFFKFVYISLHRFDPIEILDMDELTEARCTTTLCSPTILVWIFESRCEGHVIRDPGFASIPTQPFASGRLGERRCQCSEAASRILGRAILP